MKQMAEKTKKQKLDVVMGILLQLYLFFPWIVTEKGRASIHLYLLWIWEQKDPVQVYHWAFLKDMAELSENAETTAVWFLAAVLILLGVQIGELVHLFLSVGGKRYPYLQPFGWLGMCAVTAMLFQYGMMNISILDEQVVFLVPTGICAYLSGFLALDGVWSLAGKAAEQWDETSRRAKEEQEQKKWYRKERKKRLRFPADIPIYIMRFYGNLFGTGGEIFLLCSWQCFSWLCFYLQESVCRVSLQTVTERTRDY